MPETTYRVCAIPFRESSNCDELIASAIICPKGSKAFTAMFFALFIASPKVIGIFSNC